MFDFAWLKKVIQPEIDKRYNIWTIRLTPIPHVDIDSQVSILFSNLCESKFPKIILYRENPPRGRLHYHARVCADGTWKTRKSIHDFILKAFPGQKGNSLFSTKRVFVNCKEYSSLYKSVTYISKDTNLIYSRGYLEDHLQIFEKIGRTWREIKNLSMADTIIKTYDIDKHSRGHEVVNNILLHYESIKKDTPTNHQLSKLLHLIKYKLSLDYRRVYHDRAANFYNNLEDHPLY